MTYNYSNINNRQIGAIPIALIVKGAVTLLPQIIPFITSRFKAPARDANRSIDGIKQNIANIDARERLGIVLATAQKIPYEARDVMAEKLMLWYKTNYANDYKVLLPEDKEFYNNFINSQIQQFPDGNNFWGNSRSAMFTNSEVNYNATPINTITNLFQPSGSNKGGISPIFLLAIVGGAIFLFTRKKTKIMTTAQKNAKAKFKQAIAYRQKTGVSLKEAFAHIYGKKVGSVAKKTVKTKTVKKAKLTPDDKKDKSAFNVMARKYKKARVGALKLKPNEMRLGLLSKKIGATVKKKKVSNKPSEYDILQKISKVKKSVNVLDNAQIKHMSQTVSGIGKIQNYNLIAYKGALSQLKDMETHLAILKNAKPKIVKSQLPVIRREIKNTVNSIKEIKIHITQLKKYI